MSAVRLQEIVRPATIAQTMEQRREDFMPLW
jgi:hypothetical protein